MLRFFYVAKITSLVNIEIANEHQNQNSGAEDSQRKKHAVSYWGRVGKEKGTHDRGPAHQQEKG
jgi:hypothetical protein